MDGPEREVIRRHPVIGAQLMAPLECLGEVAVIVRHHHERHDGSGYPDGLRGETIPLGSRIVAIADRYDALTSARAYRLALGPMAARERLRLEAGGALDPELTALFLAVLADDEDLPRVSRR
jgi:HD-GYP domain-containing protein (c-di-GMP phosphodiesterase class II)